MTSHQPVWTHYECGCRYRCIEIVATPIVTIHHEVTKSGVDAITVTMSVLVRCMNKFK